ncbi:Thioredoxin domain-containing protein 3-like [Stylophora pistillata]|uniref:Thioredoxin domain-containing protein 3-like n=1 Tax=Stylophora pistillata TaxID=50429 RepID=A0A2B4S579_STYPI|nr:Thioredoxin domain-containing protein 3-like [Stylophora pistillata]
MAKSKGKVELQVEIKTQEQWDELLSKEGLIVADTYSAWCGPCKAIVSSFKRLKNELGDDLLVFATAETDSINSLEAYRMKSQPTFLFYAGGLLVNVVRGCNCPALIKTIRDELDQEHKVIDGKCDRVPFVDQEAFKETVFEEKKDEEKEIEDEEEEIVELPKQVTVAIIKPDAVKAGLVDEIIQKVEESGMEVLKKEEKTLSKEEAAEFYKQHEGSEHFDQLVEFMTSGPCMTLLLSKGGDSDVGDGTIEYFRDLIGPKDVNIAKEEAPTSLRALYGTDTVMNALHGCDSAESAARELAFFYPDFVAPTVTQKRKKKRLQRTLALIRPDALRTRKDSIIRKIEESGFTIAMSKEITLSRDQAEAFYADHKDSDFFESLVDNMTSGPMMALCLAREDAVEGWREMLGPKEISVAAENAPDSLRHQFHVEDSPINPLHGSDSLEAAEKEIQQLFPVQSTVAVIKPELEPDKREEIIHRIKEAGFKIQIQKEVTLTKDLASQFYHEHEGKEFFEGLTDHMASGPTLFMVLTREDAVTGWRALMGPTDPQQASEVDPDSLRAQFGVDTLKNAVHGSSNVEKAKAVIEGFFPEVKILPDGTVAVPKEESEAEKDSSASQEEPRKQDLQLSDETFSEPLGMENGSIPPEAITASSELDDKHSPSRARLNIKPEGELVGAWVPSQSDENQWLQVNLGKVTRLVKIATQGEAGESASRHVKQFCVSYSLQGEEFIPYTEDTVEKVFESNSDQDSIAYNSLRNPIVTQFVRLNPKTWNEDIALRVELYGCDADSYSEPLGLENGLISSEAITSSSELDDKHSASRARLNSKPEGELMGAWVPLESDENQWLQVDLGKVLEVTKVSTQGGGDGVSTYVTSFILLCSEDGETFQDYQENDAVKVFEGNNDGDTVVSHWLVQPVKARYFRLQPKTWSEQIALRVELYGNTGPGETQEALQSEKTDGNVEDTPKDEEKLTEQPLSEVQQAPPQEGEDDGTKEVSNEDSNDGSTQVKEDLPQEATEDNPEGESKPEILDEETVIKKEEDEASGKGDVEVPDGQAEKQEEGNEGSPEDGQVSEEGKESTDGEKKPEEAVKSEGAEGDEESNPAAEEPKAVDEDTAPADKSVAEEVKDEEGNPNDEATS